MECADGYRVSSVASVGDVSSRECVLVVDDDPAVRRLIAGTLASAGYRVVTPPGERWNRLRSDNRAKALR